MQYGLARVSALIPTYNRARLLARAVDCVLAQTYPGCEALVIDDGSTDDTPRLIAERYAGNARVRYVWQPNRGVAAARNLGLSLARGDYIAFLDSDDLWQPWKIEAQLACLERLPQIGMIWTDMDAVDAQDRLVHRNFMRTHYGAYRQLSPERMFEKRAMLAELAPGLRMDARVHWGDVFPAMLMGNLCQPSTVLVRRACAEKAGGFNEAMRSGEDYEYHLRLAREAPAALLDIASTLYRVGAADQLTDPAYHLMIAGYTLETLSRFIEQDPERISLPRSMLRKRIAGVHEWIASEHLRRTDYVCARKHLAASLREWPWRARAWLRFCAASSPKAYAWLDAARRFVRSFLKREGGARALANEARNAGSRGRARGAGE
jgi:glycosyltransferase involved in cell wall biosynthesis